MIILENNMDNVILRTTKIGNGFVKEDVLTYLDELNSKIEGLEELQETMKQRPKSERGSRRNAVKKT